MNFPGLVGSGVFARVPVCADARRAFAGRMADDSQHVSPSHLSERFARVRRVKFLLRFVPRRARFHRYPLVGRFAVIARRRSHLWSFKTPHIRPALYAGSILSLLPFLGIQLPVAFALALLFRANFMVLGGLQFLTNPVTAVPVYYGTYKVGKAVIDFSGFGRSIELAPAADGMLAPPPPFVEPVSPSSPAATPDPSAPPAELHWTQRFGTRLNALLLGGVICGAALGAVLDLLWLWGVRRSEAHRRHVLARKTASRSTDPTPNSQ